MNPLSEPDTTSGLVPPNMLTQQRPVVTTLERIQSIKICPSLAKKKSFVTHLTLIRSDSDTFFTRYGPSFELKIKPGLRRNENVKQDLDDILEEAFGNVVSGF